MKLSEMMDRGVTPAAMQCRLDKTFPVVRLAEHHERTLYKFSFLCGQETAVQLEIMYGWRSGRWWYQPKRPGEKKPEAGDRRLNPTRHNTETNAKAQQ